MQLTSSAPRDARRVCSPGTRTLLVLVFVVVASAAAVLLSDARASTLHNAPVALVAPAAVSAPLAQDATAATGGRLLVVAQPNRDIAMKELTTGGVVAVLELDLGGHQDELTVSAVGSSRLRDAVKAQVHELENAYGRTLAADRSTTPAVPEPALVGLFLVLLGWGLVAVISLLRGPHTATRRHGVVRVGVVLGLAMLTGVGALLVTGDDGVAVVAAMAVSAAGLSALAAATLFGVLGIAVAAVGLVVAGIPVVRAGDTLLLSDEVRQALDGTVIGAVAEALRTTGTPQLASWPVGVLALWNVLGLAALVAGRWASTAPEGGRDRTTGKRHLAVPRLWRLSITATITVVIVAAGVARGTATIEPVQPTHLASLASETSCVDTGTVNGVRGLNKVTRLRGNREFRGGDVGVEARLQDGRLFWLFGDTLRGEDGAADLVRNSVLVVEPGCLRVVRAAGGGAVIPDRDDGVGYWPMSVTVDRNRGYDLVTVFAQRVRTIGAGVFDFEVLGPTAAKFLVPVGGPPQLVTVRDLGVDDTDVERPMWGAASLVDDGWLYVYGTSRRAEIPSFGFGLSVARVRPDKVLQLRSWEFWDGDSWAADGDGFRLIEPVGGVSETLSVFRRGPTWYAFSKRDEFLGRDLVFWTASSPTGPFTAQPPTADLPSDLAEGELRYMPLAHPDLFSSPGSIIVSYSRNRTEFGAVIDDPLQYRPRFLKLPLPRG
jgi:hypothetical protein